MRLLVRPLLHTLKLELASILANAKHVFFVYDGQSRMGELLGVMAWMITEDFDRAVCVFYAAKLYLLIMSWSNLPDSSILGWTQ